MRKMNIFGKNSSCNSKADVDHVKLYDDELGLYEEELRLYREGESRLRIYDFTDIECGIKTFQGDEYAMITSTIERMILSVQSVYCDSSGQYHLTIDWLGDLVAKREVEVDILGERVDDVIIFIHPSAYIILFSVESQEKVHRFCGQLEGVTREA